MKIYSTYQNFKGYDAVPIKNIYINSNFADDVVEELKTALDEDEINLHCISDTKNWYQDIRLFLKDENNKPYALSCMGLPTAFQDYLNKFNIEVKPVDTFCDGGNIFIGKNDNNERWVMVGKTSYGNIGKKSISKTYNVKQKNIFPISQQNFHLDMFLRPVGFPYVLVDNPNLAIENVEKMQDGSEEKKHLLKLVKAHINSKKYWAKFESTVADLKKHGLIPIEIAGDYLPEVNFMNAIVHKKKDGSLSYITSSSRCCSDKYSEFMEIFENELKSKVPNVSSVRFVAGKNNSEGQNFLMWSLDNLSGGLHCMTLEEPDFEKWI